MDTIQDMLDEFSVLIAAQQCDLQTLEPWLKCNRNIRAYNKFVQRLNLLNKLEEMPEIRLLPENSTSHFRSPEKDDKVREVEIAFAQLFLKLQRAVTPAPTIAAPLETVRLLCSQFHAVARQLRSRHDKRPTLDVKDEYDVQDLLHALLRIHFADVRPEEWTPSYAGKSARMDFLLKDEDLVIEVKHTRDGLADKEIGDQLIVDIGRYKSHPNCKTLFCFVYDPNGRIGNPRGMENDLSATHDGLQVHVLVAP